MYIRKRSAVLEVKESEVKVLCVIAYKIKRATLVARDDQNLGAR